MTRSQIEGNIERLYQELRSEKITVFWFQKEIERVLFSYTHLSRENERMINDIVNDIEEILYTVPESMQAVRAERTFDAVKSLVEMLD